MTKRSGRGRKRRLARPRAPAAGISRLFGGRAIVALLKLFLSNPARDFYQRELVALTGERLFLVQTALRKLREAQIIGQVSRGNRIYYRVDPSHPVYQELKALILKTVGFGDVLRTHLKALSDRIRVAFIYGSVARGDEAAGSDIDVMLIGDISGRQVAPAIAAVRRSLNREVNPSTYSADEFRRKYREGSPFIKEVVSDTKIFVMGNESAFKKVLTGRST